MQNRNFIRIVAVVFALICLYQLSFTWIADNVEKDGIPAAVAGPYVRGDLGTITKHIDALHVFEPNLIPFYCQLALVGFGFAEEKGTLTSDQRSQIRSMLNKALVETKE